MECPVCHHKNIPSEARECPNCHSDLEAFHLIKDLERYCRSRKVLNLILGIIATLLLVLWIGTIFYMHNKSEDLRVRAAESEILIDQLTEENQMFVRENEKLRDQILQIQTKVKEQAPEPEIITHVVKYGETLFYIAQKYFGNGYLYGKIACDNDIDDPDFILEGQKVYVYKYQPRL